MLQLVAVACIALAAKQEEVEQPTASEWADISDNCFQVGGEQRGRQGGVPC
jgi:hypothetical protein